MVVFSMQFDEHEREHIFDEYHNAIMYDRDVNTVSACVLNRSEQEERLHQELPDVHTRRL